ncbi:diacylglycerol O-acyltransferase 2 isoform X3 [Castor canadensis]|uniref:Diacylglycerol O-acyltransferase 2 isoform X3 n=1 Tax=Castor canadensis TaxID=51338 RepID=A0AC58NAU1_CASCN
MKTLIAAYSGVLRGERRAAATRSESSNGGSALSPQRSGRWGAGSSILSALQDIFSVTWLNRSKVEKQLQVISVLQWVLSFLVLGVACSVILMYTFCTDCWLIAVLYFTWLAFDWNTPKKGGRRSQWVRNWAVWRYFRDYFPIQLVKTHNLLTTRNYIFGYHPHGIMGLGAFCNFSTEATEVSKKFPGIRPYLATLAGNFRMPVLREYLMSGGICPVNRDTIDYLLSKNGSGNAIIIVVGGAAESLSSMPGKNAVTLRNRKGFVKLALRHGKPGAQSSCSCAVHSVRQHIQCHGPVWFPSSPAGKETETPFPTEEDRVRLSGAEPSCLLSTSTAFLQIWALGNLEIGSWGDGPPA